MNNLNGLIYFDKPVGKTSSDCLYPFKKILRKSGFKKTKIGHFGTLDPFASGLLIIAFGSCTRLADYVHADCPKQYWAQGKFGVMTDSGDLTGKEIKTSELPSNLNEAAITEAFLGDYFQVPPSLSAAKHEGKALYEWAREGVKIEKEAVKRFIFDLKFEKLNPELAQFTVTVSSGTYIRTLMEDIALKLNSSGHLEKLRRLKIGLGSVDNCIDQVPEDIDQLKSKLISPAELLPYPHVNLQMSSQIEDFRHGRSIKIDQDNGLVWVKDLDGELCGLGHIGDNCLTVRVNMLSQD